MKSKTIILKCAIGWYFWIFLLNLSMAVNKFETDSEKNLWRDHKFINFKIIKKSGTIVMKTRIVLFKIINKDDQDSSEIKNTIKNFKALLGLLFTSPLDRCWHRIPQTDGGWERRIPVFVWTLPSLHKVKPFNRTADPRSPFVFLQLSFSFH